MYDNNSAPPSATDTRQWTRSASIHAMACRLFGAKPLPEPFWLIVNWTHGNNSVKFEYNLIILIQENAFENVICQDGGHFVQGIWVKGRMSHITQV